MPQKPPYRVCPDCGSHLDPGEPCDCKRQHLPEAVRAKAQCIAQSTGYRDAMYKKFLGRSYR